MKKFRNLPVPFLILILAGVVLLFSLVRDRTTGAGTVPDDSVQLQTVEQERIAAVYFRILSWVSNINAKGEEPAKPAVQPVSAPGVKKTGQSTTHPGRIEPCTLLVGQSPSPVKHGARNN